MNNLEHDYNQALGLLKKGLALEDILNKFPSSQKELEPLLKISSALLSMPKNVVPTPLMRRQYAAAPVKQLWLAWLHVSKFVSVSVSLVLLLSAVTVTGYQALQSKPGNTLFPVKKSAEQLHLVLSFNQDSKANLQLQIAQSRLNDAEAIFSDPSSNESQKTAALNELTAQTTSAITEASTVATNDPKSKTADPLINSLTNLTKNQQTLLAGIQAKTELASVAKTAKQQLDQNSAKLSQIQRSLAVASSDQDLAQLQSEANSVAVLGQISKISKDEITVEKTNFNLTPQTLIKDSDGNILNIKDLNQDTKVNVFGLKNQNTLVAQQILVMAQTQDRPAASSSALTGTETLSTSPEKTLNSSSTSAASQVDPNAATGSFILEDPSPQFLGH